MQALLRRSSTLIRPLIPVSPREGCRLVANGDTLAWPKGASSLNLDPALSPEPEPAMHLKVIGLTGQAGHGKDTVANYLQNYSGYTVLHYASPLKEAASTLFDLPLSVFYDGKKKEVADEEWGISPRVIMQWLGTDIMRARMGEDFWLRHMRRRLAALPLGTKVVVADCRFENEVEMLRLDYGAEIWHVDASSRLTASGGGPLDAQSAKHVTEQGVPRGLIDVILFNNNTKEDLFENIECLLEGK
jgi:hypothetical protein